MMIRQSKNQKSVVRLDRYSQVVLTAIALLLSVIAFELFASSSVSQLPTATAQIPDTALQRKQLVDEQRESNKHLSEIVKLLKSGTIKVRVDSVDSEKEPPKRTRGPASGR